MSARERRICWQKKGDDVTEGRAHAKFAQLSRFVNELQASGHNAKMIEVPAHNHHGATLYSLVAAGDQEFID